MSSLKFTFLQDNQVVALLDLGMDDLIAVEDCVRSILGAACPNLESQDYFFRIVSMVESLEDEDEPTEDQYDGGIRYGLLRCRSFNEDHEQQPEYIPASVLKALAGKKFKVHPHSNDTQDWGQECYIRFSSKAGGLEPLAAPGAPSAVSQGSSV